MAARSRTPRWTRRTGTTRFCWTMRATTAWWRSISTTSRWACRNDRRCSPRPDDRVRGAGRTDADAARRPAPDRRLDQRRRARAGPWLRRWRADGLPARLAGSPRVRRRDRGRLDPAVRAPGPVGDPGRPGVRVAHVPRPDVRHRRAVADAAGDAPDGGRAARDDARGPAGHRQLSEFRPLAAPDVAARR